MKSDADKINQFLDEQLLDLELKFNQFMKEMEDDLIFPSFMATGLDTAWDDDLFLNTPTHNKSNKITFDKHTTALFITSSITLSVLVYLGMVLTS